jgi:tetratricopeptide (TPR) repeat protein
MDNPNICCVCATAADSRCACQAEFYCGQLCQKAHWSKHKKECSVDLAKKVQTKRKEHGKDDERVGEANFNLGVVQQKQGQYTEAEKVFKEAHRIFSVVHRHDHKMGASTCCNLGVVYAEMGQFSKSLEMHKDALQIGRKTQGDRHPDVAVWLSNIGVVYQLKGNLKEALEHFLEAVDIEYETEGRESSSAAAKMNIIGDIYSQLGEDEKAVKTWEEAITNIRHATTHGTDDIVACGLATMLCNVGNIYRGQGHLRGALGKLSNSLEIRLRLHGKNHPDVADVLFSIACIKRAKGYDEEALKMHFKSLKINRRLLRDDQNVAMGIGAIAAIYADQNKALQALEMYEEGLGVLIRAVGLDDPDVALFRCNIAVCKEKLEDQEGALKSVQEARRIYSKLNTSTDSEAAQEACDVMERIKGKMHIRA